MKERLRDKAFKNFFILAHKLYNPRIVVDPKLIYEFIDKNIDPDNSYLDYKRVLILKRRIGIYSNGEMIKPDIIGKEFGLSELAISRAIDKTIDTIYKRNTEIKSEIIKAHPTLQEEFMKHEIDDLEFNYNDTKKIKEKGYKTIEDLLYSDEKTLRQEFRSRLLFNKKILERLNMFGYRLKSDVYETPIEQKFVSKKTLSYLKQSKIYTVEELQENISCFKRKNFLDKTVKNELIDISKGQYIQNDISILDLLEKKKQEEKKINALMITREMACQNAYLIIDSDIEMKKQMLKEIEVKLNNITLVIQTEEEILKGIVEEIRKKFERKTEQSEKTFVR